MQSVIYDLVTTFLLNRKMTKMARERERERERERVRERARERLIMMREPSKIGG